MRAQLQLDGPLRLLRASSRSSSLTLCLAMPFFLSKCLSAG
jgi:hypothetical protein